MVDEKILNKIKNILNKTTENGATEEEAQSAMLMAQKMMAKHNLSMSDIDIGSSTNKEVIDVSFMEFKKMPWWAKHLLTIVANNFRCSPYILMRGKASMPSFIGLKEDVEIAKEIYIFAVNSIKYYSDEFIKKLTKQGFPTRGVRNDYIKGFLSGLEDKFKEQVEENNWGLILVKDEAVVEYTNKMNFRKGTASKITTAGMSEATKAGYKQGKQFSSPKKMIEE